MMSEDGSLEARDPASGLVTIVPDPEVPERVERARRRQFTVGYKLRILTEADAARTPSEIGALLRREGLYSSHLAAWRRQRAEGILHALIPRWRGRLTHSPEQRELVRLRQENERLGQRLAVAEAVIEIQKTRLGAVGPGRAERRQRRALLIASATELAPVVGVRGACQAVGVGRASFYRHARGASPCPASASVTSGSALETPP